MLTKMDVNRILDLMPNKRYSMVLRELYINGVEKKDLAEKMGITLANLYNIILRAKEQFAKIYKENRI